MEKRGTLGKGEREKKGQEGEKAKSIHMYMNDLFERDKIKRIKGKQIPP